MIEAPRVSAPSGGFCRHFPTPDLENVSRVDARINSLVASSTSDWANR
jgi:hypothetical protein